mmetsp:Transcript_7813/g.30838  ORF Transcript_7813/g.30838 Transcript_7813/m.30838 type:complete len:246 (+) Transcript_7813:600-1337(+)
MRLTAARLAQRPARRSRQRCRRSYGARRTLRQLRHPRRTKVLRPAQACRTPQQAFPCRGAPHPRTRTRGATARSACAAPWRSQSRSCTFPGRGAGVGAAQWVAAALSAPRPRTQQGRARTAARARAPVAAAAGSRRTRPARRGGPMLSRETEESQRRTRRPTRPPRLERQPAQGPQPRRHPAAMQRGRGELRPRLERQGPVPERRLAGRGGSRASSEWLQRCGESRSGPSTLPPQRAPRARQAAS